MTDSAANPLLAGVGASQVKAIGAGIGGGEAIRVVIRCRYTTVLVLTSHRFIHVDPGGRLKSWPLSSIVDIQLGWRGVEVKTRLAADGTHPAKIESHVWAARASDAASSVEQARAILSSRERLELERDLARASDGWTTLVIVRSFPADAAGQLRLREETELLGRHGYIPSMQLSQTGKLKTSQLILTGGIGAAFGYARGKGGIHRIGTIAVTFTKAQGR